MREVLAPSLRGRVYGRQLREALEQLDELVVDGLRHGFFNYSIECAVKDDRRHLVIHAGLSHKFTIPKDELPR
jgi:hypothetical protein